jgi:hypothetical protein
MRRGEYGASDNLGPSALTGYLPHGRSLVIDR